jgi:hypothetical protein
MRARDVLRACRRWWTEAPGCKPGWSPLAACEAGDAAPAPGFTTADRQRLGDLAVWWESAGEGARIRGEGLAGRLRDELPDIPATITARVLLCAGRHIGGEANDEDDDHAALQSIADMLQAAPTVLADMAAIDEELSGMAEERRWR